MTIEESDNPGGTFQFKDNTAISQNVSINKHKSCLGHSRMFKQSCHWSGKKHIFFKASETSGLNFLEEEKSENIELTTLPIQ